MAREEQGEGVGQHQRDRWAGSQGTEGQQGTGTGHGIPWGRQRGQGEGSVGDVDERDTPVGRDRGQGTERSVQRDAPAQGEEQHGVPEDSVPVTRGV